MTIEEKRKYANDFCAKTTHCGQCAIASFCKHPYKSFFDFDEAELDKIISKIHKSYSPDKEVEQELVECESKVEFSKSYEDMVGEAVYVKFRINSIVIDKNGVRYNLVSEEQIGSNYMQLNYVEESKFERGST